MELKVLGCHGGESTKHRTSSFLVDGRVAVDAGAITSMCTLEEQNAIEAVLVSHPHLDHVRDLATIADNRCQQGGPTLMIASTKPTIEALQKHFFNNVLWPDFSRIPAGKHERTIEFKVLDLEQRVEVAGMGVVPIAVTHTIDACGFVVDHAGAAVAYSGDTGPTDRFWEVLDSRPDLRALIMEISFPNHQHRLAQVSAHHTPETLEVEMKKLHEHAHLPTLLFHIKPLFQQMVERELGKIRTPNVELQICQLGDQFLL